MSEISETERKTRCRLLGCRARRFRDGNLRALLTPKILHLLRKSLTHRDLLLQYVRKAVGHILCALCRFPGSHLRSSTETVELVFSSTAVEVQGFARSSCLLLQHAPLSPGLPQLSRTSAGIGEGALLLIQHFLLLFRKKRL